MAYDGSSVMAVFDAIAENRQISRAEISQITGFSQVTVGKVVDMFDSLGIISQYKKESSSVGRKTGICALNESFGMILLDLRSMTGRITDIALNDHGGFDFDKIEDAISLGFSHYVSGVGGELMGIGCVVPDGKLEEYTQRIIDAVGQAPELTIEAGKAAAVANAARFDEMGCAIYIDLGIGISGAIIMDGKLYYGANDRAGDLSCLMTNGALDTAKLFEICKLLDPALIHITCDDSAVFDPSLLQNTNTQIIVEDRSLCPDAMRGVARMLREKWVISKLA